MEELVKPIAFTLLHSIWQGALLLLIYWLCSKIISTSKAALRYNLASLLMFSFVVGSLFTFLHHLQADNHMMVKSNEALTLLFIGEEISKTSFSLSTILYENLHSIVILWSIGVVIMLLRMTGSVFYLRYLIHNSEFIQIEEWVNSAKRLQLALSINRNIGLRFSKHVDVPCVIGFIKPVILFPIAYSSSLTIQQVETILAHELAHIKRHDFLINVLQSIVEILFFFNPFVWVISNIMKTEREHATDDMAVALLNDKTNYIKTLAAIEQVRFQPMLVNGFATNNNLITRIKRLTGMKTQNLKDVKIIVLLVTAAMIMSFGWLSSREEKLEEYFDSKAPFQEKVSNNSIVDLPDVGVALVTQTDVQGSVSENDEVNYVDDKILPPLTTLTLTQADSLAKEKSKSKSKNKFKHKEEGEEQEDFDNDFDFNEDWDSWSQELTEKLENELRKLEYIQQGDMEELMHDFKRIMAEMDRSSIDEQREMASHQRLMALEQKRMAEEHKRMAHEQKRMAEQMRQRMYEDKLQLKEDLEKHMEELNKQMKIQEKEMKRIEVEMRTMEEFENKLTRELIKDGYLKEGETIDKLDISKDGDIKVNGIKIDNIKDSKKYLNIYEEVIGEKKGNFTFRKEN